MAEQDDSEMIPLYAVVEGDTVATLVLARSRLTMADVVERALRSAGVRVAPGHKYFVVLDGRPVGAETTVREAGFGALDRVDVRRRS